MSCSRPWFDESIVDFNGNKIPIPCGSCLSCRLDIQKMAIDRMWCAYSSHPVSAFVTFTYDDNHLIIKDGFKQPTLSKDDAHKYLDKIRHYNLPPFEYYMACESGSRAWGFESQDSDYDIRFLYVRNVEDYIAVEAPRDVLEIPTDEVWDINGWDLAKALKLLVKGNSNLLEWLHSPIQYVENPKLCQSLLELVKGSVSFKKLFYSYQGMAKNNYREYLKGDEVWIKKYLYVLRPLLACLWVEHHQNLPPVRFEKLVDYATKEFPNLKRPIEELLILKRGGLEKEMGPRMPELDQFIETMIHRDFSGDDVIFQYPITQMNEIFRKWVLNQ